MLQKHLNELLLILDLPFQLSILPSICLILATTIRLLLVLGVPIDSLHHNVPVLGIDPVVRVDVLLDNSARNPPLHNIAKRKTKNSKGKVQNKKNKLK